MENGPFKQLSKHLQFFSKLTSAAALYQKEEVSTFHSSNMIKVNKLALDISVGAGYAFTRIFFFHFDYILLKRCFSSRRIFHILSDILTIQWT